MPKTCIYLCGISAFVLSNDSSLVLFVGGVIKKCALRISIVGGNKNVQGCNITKTC